MRLKPPAITFFIIVFAFLPGLAALAQDDEPSETVEETQAVEEDTGTEDGQGSWLDGYPQSQGNITLVFRPVADGEESPFYGRYHDAFDVSAFYIGEIYSRGFMGDTQYRFRLSDSWEDSWNGSIEFRDPGGFGTWISGDFFNYHEIPSTFTAERDTFNAGVDYQADTSSMSVNYANRTHAVNLLDDAGTVGDWESDQVNVGLGLQLSDWDVNLDVMHRNYYDGNSAIDDTDCTTGTLRAGRNFGDDTYLEGNLAYGLSGTDSGDDLRSFNIGGYGRFLNFMGIELLNVSGSLNFENRSEGPSLFHPAGDTFNFDLGGDWRAAPDIRVHASWDHTRGDVTHADQYTQYIYYADPPPEYITNTRFFTDKITTNRFNFGGIWTAMSDLEVAADWNFINRSGLPGTDFTFPGSPALRWDSESHNIYTMRYRPGRGTGWNDWYLKYETEDRSNGERDASSNMRNLSLNWSGMVGEDFWINLGGGYLKTGNSVPGYDGYSQRGSEYGIGWSWYFNDGWSFHGDYRDYDVGGEFGYDQTTFNTGLSCDINDVWEWSILYEMVKGDFTISDDLDYDVKEVMLEISYGW